MIQLCAAGGIHSRLSAVLVLMEQGLDIGPKSVVEFQKALQGAKSVIWNGPMGVFEMKPFAKGTNAIAQTLAQLTSEVCSWSIDVTTANGNCAYIMVPTTVIAQRQQLLSRIVVAIMGLQTIARAGRNHSDWRGRLCECGQPGRPQQPDEPHQHRRRCKPGAA